MAQHAIRREVVCYVVWRVDVVLLMTLETVRIERHEEPVDVALRANESGVPTLKRELVVVKTVCPPDVRRRVTAFAVAIPTVDHVIGNSLCGFRLGLEKMNVPLPIRRADQARLPPAALSEVSTTKHLVP